jgi:hypothetical protein
MNTTVTNLGEQVVKEKSEQGENRLAPALCKERKFQ